MSTTATEEPETELGTVFQLGYASAASRPFSDDELIELLAKARANNQRLGVTGMLLYHEGSFLQVLEGRRKTVEALYEVIAADPRHTDAMLLFRQDDDQRRFEDWTMGFHHLKRDGSAVPPGLNRFLQTGATGLVEEDGEKLRQVLLGFREGRWRRVIDH